MKKVTALLILLLSISFIACSTDEAIDRSVLEEEGGDTTSTDPDDDNDEEIIIDEEIITATETCLISDIEFLTGEPTKIDCLLDLEGKEVNIPANVIIEFDGGDIFNGTLNFSGDNKISGELLNSELTIEGDVSLVSDEFQFIASRWGIVQGRVSDEVAKNNRLFMNKAFIDIKELGVTTIIIDNINAYFNNIPTELHERPIDAAIQVLADTKLIMTDNSHLRTQPNNFKNTILITLFEANNSVIEGGTLHGDRDEHDYSDGGSHEWGHLIQIIASKNVTVKNVTMLDAGGDGVSIQGLGHAFNDDYVYCDNVNVLNNTITRSRRLGIGITDGKNILIEGNELIDSGVATEKSNGTAPQFAIDIEPIWSGGLKFEIVENVIIRNNIERGSEKGGIVNARGYYITYEGNKMESTIYIGETIGSIVRNNTFENPTKNSTVAIFAGNNDAYGEEKNSDNEVYGNTIIGFSKGIQLQDPGIDLHSNTMINCGSGIQIKNARNCKIRDNIITNEVSDSEGIGTAFPDYIDDVVISDNTIEVKGSPFRFTAVNLADGQEEFNITVENNLVTSLDDENSSFGQIRGFKFINNTCNNSGIRTVRASKGNIVDNKFINGVMRISGGCEDLNFIDNTVTGGSCFNDDNTDAVNIIKENNTCE